MNRRLRYLPVVMVFVLLFGCAGIPVQLGSRISGDVLTGPGRPISAEACGFQLLLLIPIALNNRMERAYRSLQEQAGGDFITDVQIKERWIWGLVGTGYCTDLTATAIPRKQG